MPLTNFPTGLDTIVNLPQPGSNAATTAPSHAGLHDNISAAIVAIETKLGANSSVDTSSIDYKVNSHIANTSNPHSTTKSQVGLGSVDNTSDATKQLATLQAVYPVGSIYMNASNSANPGTLLGFGTWAAFAAGRVLVGNGTSDQAFVAGATGGESNHTLTISEIPHVVGQIIMHNSGGYTNVGGVNGAFSSGATLGQYSSPPLVGSANSIGVINFDNGGGGGAHNNLQPYIVVYMWRRTA